MAGLSLRKICKDYDSVSVLRGIDLEIEQGEEHKEGTLSEPVLPKALRLTDAELNRVHTAGHMPPGRMWHFLRASAGNPPTGEHAEEWRALRIKLDGSSSSLHADHTVACPALCWFLPVPFGALMESASVD